MNWFNEFDWAVLMATSVATVIVVEALKRTTPKRITGKTLLPITSLLMVLLFIPFDISDIDKVRKLLFNILVNASFSILFYEFGGKKVVDWLFTTVLAKFFPTQKKEEDEQI